LARVDGVARVGTERPDLVRVAFGAAASRGSGPRGPTPCSSPAVRGTASRDREARLRASNRRDGVTRVGTERPDSVRVAVGAASRGSGPRDPTPCASRAVRSRAGTERPDFVGATGGTTSRGSGPRGPAPCASDRRAARECAYDALSIVARCDPRRVPPRWPVETRPGAPRRPVVGRGGGCMARRAIERHRHTLHVSRRRLPGWCDGASRIRATASPGLGRRRLPGWCDGASRIRATAPPGLGRRRLPGSPDLAFRGRGLARADQSIHRRGDKSGRGL
jgi:hypothetical protein